ncbi:MAG TPA: hypothetical protein VMS64_29570 [Candidatus Methylomirabilis sp.]|nr:hypothetical protein [Candidatus Methylomirabilis sp.]
MKRGDEFFNLYNHDFVRVTAATPLVRVPAFNARQTIDLAERAAELNGVLVLFPELGLSALVPNGPEVGSGGSLSPRSDYRAPSNGEAAVWLAQLDLVPDADPAHSWPAGARAGGAATGPVVPEAGG